MANGISREVREHFGQGRFAFDPEKAVFINCPFDDEFEPMLDAILFTTVCCGFIPRSALESGTTAQYRMDRIARAIFSSKYSIHDLSRCRGEGDDQLARFNMPLELGIAMAHRFLGDHRHDWLALVPEGHGYLKFISDLAGFDLTRHNGRIESVVPGLMAWLLTRPDAVPSPKPDKVLARLPDFQAEMDRLRAQWVGQRPPWVDLVRAALDLSETI